MKLYGNIIHIDKNSLLLSLRFSLKDPLSRQERSRECSERLRSPESGAKSFQRLMERSLSSCPGARKPLTATSEDVQHVCGAADDLREQLR